MTKFIKNIWRAAGCAGLQLCLVLTVKAQINRDTTVLKPLPNITGWLDNAHYIQEKYSGKTKLRTAINIHTGKQTILSSKPVDSGLNRVEVINGDLYWEAKTRHQRLTNTPEIEKLPSVSPDKRWVAFLRGNDLYTLELATGRELRFTHDGSETVLNGYASWVYYEEILKRDSQYQAFWWSPDSKNIAFYRFDDSRVPLYRLYNPLGQHGLTEQTRYPQPGDNNPGVKIGFASLSTTRVVWADFDETADQYFGKPIWRPNSSGLLVQWMPRRQNNLKLFDVEPNTGKTKEVYTEEQKTWVDWIDRFYWLSDGFLMVRDFDGWEQIYAYNNEGKLRKKLTNGKNWRIEIERIDEKNKMVYFSSNAEQSTRTDFYRVAINGKEQKKLSFGPYSQEKSLLSPDGKHLIIQHSNVITPSRIDLVNTSNGRIYPIADSKGKSFNQSEGPKREIIWMETKEGLRLPACITWPAHLEKGRKYPMSIQVYGGPKRESVSDKWSNPITDSGENEVIKVLFDHRGSGHAGKQGLNYLYGNLGKWEMEDYISWMKLLLKNPYIDSSKVMISGGSYGGYLTALALTYGAAYFKYGMADYPVIDWRLYDSHYTERYMGLPKDNPDGYAFGSVLSHLDGYQSYGPSMLLIQHGAMDDNVHIQNTYQLTNMLQRKKKPFEMMVYPTERHGWLGPKISFMLANKKRFQEQYLFNNKKTKNTE